MTPLLITCLLLCQTVPRTAPVAMVLLVRGKIEIRPVRGEPRTVQAQDLLYVGDRLIGGGDNQVTLVFFGGGRQERLKGEATVAKAGCTPQAVVEVLKEGKTAEKAIKEGLERIRGSSRAATAVVRNYSAEDEPAVTPIVGTALLKTQPEFSWPAHPQAKNYLLELYTNTGRLVWRAESAKPRLSYPADQKPLSHNREYTWKVYAKNETEVVPIASADFFIVLAGRAVDLKALEPLAKSSDPSDLHQAALLYEINQVYEEALPLYERLCKLSPREPALHAARAMLYEQSGRKEEAKEAWAQAEKLGYLRPAKNNRQP